MEKYKNILVTGGAGYIGSHTVVKLSEFGYRAIIVDDFRNSHQTVIEQIQGLSDISPIVFKEDCSYEEAMRKVFSSHPIHSVIHFAALKSVEESVQDPHAYFKNNMSTLLLITELMNEFDVKNLVFSSSCTVYGEPKTTKGITEDQPFQQAKTPYGYSKQMAENFLQYLVKSSSNQIKPVILRYFNPIGAHPSGLLGENPVNQPKNLVPLVCQSATGQTGPIQVFGNDYPTKDGSCVRDFIHVMDLADAHIRAMQYCDDMPESIDVFNVGTGQGSTVLELISTFEQQNNVEVPFLIQNRREGDIVQIYADTTKIEKLLKWQTQYSFHEALKHAWKWQLNLVNQEHLTIEI